MSPHRIKLTRRYLNLCYGDPLFTKNPSLGSANEGQRSGPPGSGGAKECRYLHFHVQPARAYHTVVPAGESGVMGGIPESVHRALLADVGDNGENGEIKEESGRAGRGIKGLRGIKQWIDCDLRSFDYSVLGQ